VEHSLAIDLDEATRFLRRLDPDPKARFAFQVFDDAKLGRINPRVLWSPCANRLEALNRRGAGVFVAPNRFTPSATERTNENVVGFRCCYADLDGAPLEPVLAAPLPPRIVVETSPGRWHAHWPLEGDCDARAWLAVQATLAARFRSDATMDKPCGVVRLPGFWHLKGEPSLVRIERLSEERSYRIEELVSAFDVTVPDAEERRNAAPIEAVVGEGHRDAALTSLAGSMRDRGCDEDEIVALLLVANRKRCRPPKPEAKVRAIARSVARYEVGKAWWAVGDAEDAALDEKMRMLDLTSDDGWEVRA
jgi:hypothetical protein